MLRDIIIAVLALICATLAVFLFVYIKRSKKALSLLESAKTEAGKSIEAAQVEARAKGELLANMSHEIRTPMNAISCVTELLIKEELPDTSKSYLGILKSASDSLLGIVNDILDFSKMDAGKMKLVETEYKVKSLVEDVKNIIMVRLGGKDVAFTVDIDPSLPATLIGDEVRIKQILINLLGNSIKYTTNGCIGLKIGYERLAKDTVDLNLFVNDTGCGIPPSEKEKLFKRFEQADAKNHRYTEGTGLGLSICNQLATLMGGYITMESELGRGSSFCVTIRQKVAESDNTPVANVSRNFSLDFVVWDENTYYSDGISNVLSALGITVNQVHQMSELEALLSSVRIDYILATARHFDEIEGLCMKTSPATKVALLAEIDAPVNNADERIVIRKPVDVFSIAELLCTDTEKSIDVEAGTHMYAPNSRFLLVDDNRVNLKVAKALFETFKAKVVAVDSGFEAVELIKMGEKFDLIFMDHMMPGMDGIETSKRIWEIEGENKTPVIALTANAGGGVEKLFFEAGLSDFIPKPIVMKHLNYVIRKWVPEDRLEIVDSKKNDKSTKFSAYLPELDFEASKGLEKVWNEAKIYCETLHLYLDRSESLIKELTEAPVLAERIEKLKVYKNLCEAVGATNLVSFVAQTLNVGIMGEESLFDEKLKKLPEKSKIVCSKINEYLSNEELKDVLTFA